LSIRCTTWPALKPVRLFCGKTLLALRRRLKHSRWTAWDLKSLGILDQLLPEPIGGAHANPIEAADTLKQALSQNLNVLLELSSEQRRSQRYDKFRQIGVFLKANRLKPEIL